MRALSSSFSSAEGCPGFSLTRVMKHQNVNNSYIQCKRQNELNISQWRKHGISCGSSPGAPSPDAPSLVPTSSEVCIGSNIRDGSQYRRIAILKRRIEVALDGMEVLLRRRPKEPDGEEELERRRTRSIEFLSRFSRNYLFQLRMQVIELRRQMQSGSFASPGRYTQHQLLLKKLTAAYQTAVQGLQACLNQLPGLVYDSAILSKLDQLLCFLCELTTLKSQVDEKVCFIGPGDPSRQDNIKIKAHNLVEIVRKKRNEREEVYETWRATATVLAKKRFGLPPTAKAKTVSQQATQQERKSPSKPDWRGKKQWPGKKLRTVSTKTDFQGGDSAPTPYPPSNSDQPEQRIGSQADSPLDPATALELKIIMSRMKDILRGCHKPSHPPEPIYPPNVRLLCITHEDLPEADEPKGKTEEDVLEEKTEDDVFEGKMKKDVLGGKAERDVLESDDSNDNKTHLEDRIRDQADTLEETVSTAPFSQEILQPKISLDPAEPETRSPVSTTRLRRRLTPEEQRIIKYRNRFRSYKEHIRKIQHTSEEILSTVFQEVANELQPSILLDKMYYLELQG